MLIKYNTNIINIVPENAIICKYIIPDINYEIHELISYYDDFLEYSHYDWILIDRIKLVKKWKMLDAEEILITKLNTIIRNIPILEKIDDAIEETQLIHKPNDGNHRITNLKKLDAPMFLWKFLIQKFIIMILIFLKRNFGKSCMYSQIGRILKEI